MLAKVEPPATVYDTETIKALHPEDNGLVIEAVNHEGVTTVSDKVNRLKEVTKFISDYTTEQDLLKNELRQFLGDNTWCRLPDGRAIQWKRETVNYKAKEAYSSTRRVFRVLTKLPAAATKGTK